MKKKWVKYSQIMYILSRLEYGSLFCSGSNAGVVDRLQKLVKRCLRLCLKLLFDSNVAEMHLQARLLPLKIRRNISLLKIMFEESKKDECIVKSTRHGTRSYNAPRLLCPVPKTE